MNLKQKLTFIILALITIAVEAQQESNFNFYRYNMNIVNPAYAGAKETTMVNTSLRTQWTNIADAPETQTFSFGTPLGNQLGLGMSIINDRSFVEKQTYVTVDFSYQLPLSSLVSLYLGLKAGGNFYNINTSGLETYNVMSDPSLRDISSLTPNLGVGGYLIAENYFISLSVPRLLNRDRAMTEDGIATSVIDRPNIYVSSGYDYELSGDFTLEPSFMLRYGYQSSSTANITMLADYQKLIKAGFAYRTDKALSFLMKLNITDQFDLGYSYEMLTGGDIIAHAGQTHEFLLRYYFGKNKIKQEDY